MPPIRGQLLTAHYAMGTGADKPSHPLERFVQPAASSTWNTPGAKGIWGNGIGSLKPRESGSRDSNDAFSKMPTGSSALAATSEAEPNWSPWNNSADTNQGRSASGNTSPNRPRIEPLNHEMNGSGAFYSNTSHQIQPAIGQRSLARPQASSAQGSMASSAQGSNGPGAFSVAQFAPYMDEKDDVGGYGESQFSSKQRSSQDGQYALAGALARDPAIPTTSHSESDLHAANAFAGSGYGNHTHNGGPSHSQHASISHSQPGLPFSFVSGQQLDHGEMLDKLNDLNMMDGVPTNPMAANLQSYSNGQGSTAFNPTTLPWGPASQGVAPEFSKDMYYGSPGVERHAYPVDRGSPAGSAYRASLNNSKSYHGTPQQPPDPWAQPASRDPRNGQDLRRAQGHNAQFYSVPYPQQGYPTGPFDPYGGGYRVPMQPMHMGANYAMVPSYLAGPTGPSHPGRAGRDNDPSRDMRSKLLNEFRQTAKSNKRFELPQIYGHIVEFSGDQHGSRFIQEKLETANSDEKDQVFQELQMNAVQLMKDVFGNYVIQKFFEHGNQVQKKVLAGAMKGKVVDLSMQMYACRVVQKALEHVLVEQQAELVKELEPEILKVVKDQNGNHVVQKIIELVPRQHIDFIMNCFKNRVCELSTHGYGCRVIQRVLEHGAEADKVVIMAELHQHAQQLIPDNYGNYVAQHVIRKGSPEDASKMIATVTKDLIHYSKHKFASNVVEKCIEKASVEELRRIREAASVTGPNPEDLSSPLALLIKDQFGNYVIQKLLNQLKGKERQSLVDAIKPIVYPLKSVISKQPASAIDRLINLISTPAPVVNEAPASTAPASPTVQSDDASIPTPPVLTTGPNSPSSSPPSTNDGLAEDTSGRTIANASAKLSSSETVADTSIRLIV